jgi:hypothetical protein
VKIDWNFKRLRQDAAKGMGRIGEEWEIGPMQPSCQIA